jgi:hypothetical protein
MFLTELVHRSYWRKEGRKEGLYEGWKEPSLAGLDEGILKGHFLY